MRHRNDRDPRRGHGLPPDVDPLFAEALAGESGRGRSGGKRRQKALQLCRQVERVLSLSLGDGRDGVLTELTVESVVPAPGSSQLLVRVIVPPRVGVVTALEHLDRHAARLRAEVARAVTRKRVPELAFIPVGPAEARP